MLTFDTAAQFRTPTNALHPGTFLDTGMVPQTYDARVRRELFVRSCELVQRFIPLPLAARRLLA
jgi:hypothetical protein